MSHVSGGTTNKSKSETAIVLCAHGTVASLDELPEFLTNIRRGHPAPPELVAEVRRRYELIGGKSPLLDITRDVATKLEAQLELPTRVAMRLFHPYPKDVIAELFAKEGIRKIITVALAQHSASVYNGAVRSAAAAVDPSIEVHGAENWGRTPELTKAFADAIEAALAKVPAGEGERTALVLTAHSLPLGIVQAGDPYEIEVRASAEDIVRLLKSREKVATATAAVRFAKHMVAFQSAGIGTGIEWLGPDLHATLTGLAKEGIKHVVVGPIGFLADHVEILYDLDIEAKAWAEELGIVLYRSTSLNATSGLIDALATVARGVLRATTPKNNNNNNNNEHSEVPHPRQAERKTE